MDAKKVAVIGECMVELQKQGELYKQAFGGDTLNTAVYLSRLTKDHGITTSYFTGLGKDPFSEQMISEWKKENINTDYTYISETKLPGLYAISTTPDGERSFQYWRSDAAARFFLRDIPLDQLVTDLGKHQLIYLSGVTLAILPEDCLETLFTAITRCKEKGDVKVAFDNNFRPKLWASQEAAQESYKKILSLADMAFLTFDDEELLYGDTEVKQAIERTRSLGVSEIVIKCGAEPCIVVVDDKEISVAATAVTNVVDTTAAGDSFSAGYLAKRLLGGSPEESAAAGHKVAGTVIQHRGAIIASEYMPTI